MTCEECLSALETESLREMSADSPVMQHSATCPDCARVTTMVRDKEYETATVLNSLPPMSDPLAVAETAGRTDQRRRVGQFVVMLSAIAGAVIIWIVSATMVVPGLYRAGVIGGGRQPGAMRTGVLRTETMPLTCLSPQQAADIINPYIRESGSIYFVPASGISAITVRGTPEELAKSRDLINRFERDPSAACRATATTVRRLRRSLDEADHDAPAVAGPPSGEGPSLLGPKAGGSLLTPNQATTAPKKE
jgi:hypothetical protein